MEGRVETPSLQCEPLIRRALEIHNEQHRKLGHMAAFYQDGIGMLLDANGYSRKAESHRRRALKIASYVHGPVNENTGSVSVNLGLCLLRQKKYHECDQYLGNGLRILIDSVGMSHVSTAAAVYNLYCSLSAQKKLGHLKIPQRFTEALPRIREVTNQIIRQKFVTVVMLSAMEVAANLKNIVADPHLRA